MGDWRAAVLRRLARRFQIGPDVLRHLSTFQRLGELFEIEPPREVLPIGARTLARGLRTRGAAQIRPDWLWPIWLERQLDPRSPYFIPRGHLPFASNVTGRNWTGLGNLNSPWTAIVDPAGLVTVNTDSWSLDWWIEDDGHWLLPSREVDAHQSVDFPIIDTVMDLSDGGRATQRVYPTTSDAGEFVAVEVVNGSRRPFRVAFAVRPYNPEGLAVVERVRIEATRIWVDGLPAVMLPQPPERVAASTFRGGDSLYQITHPRAHQSTRADVSDPAGLAQAAVVYRVPAGDSVTVTLPLPPRPMLEPVPAVADASTVVGQWERRLSRAMRVRLPDERLNAAVNANRAYLLMLHDPGSMAAGPMTYHRFWFRDAAFLLEAMDRWGLHEEARDVLRSYPDRQRRDGYFYSQWREWDANGAAIWSIAEHYRLTRDRSLLDELVPAVRMGVNWIERTRSGQESTQARLRGLMPAGVSAEHLGPFDFYYWDNFWCLRGMVDAADIARVVGRPDAAAAIEAAAGRYHSAIVSSIASVTQENGRVYIPAGPYRRVDAAVVNSLVACCPLRLFPADHPLIAGTAEMVRANFMVGDAVYQAIAHTGLATYLTLQLALVELERGEPRAWRRLRWMLDAATPTFTWPEAVHPQVGGGCMGDGHHGWAGASFLTFVRSVLALDRADGRVAVLSILPPEWRGRDLEVLDAPTHQGLLSYQLSWDGDRPVLDWRWRDGAGRLCAPGLDPEWSSDAPGGRFAFTPVGV